jgi:hypothetical protein
MGVPEDGAGACHDQRHAGPVAQFCPSTIVEHKYPAAIYDAYAAVQWAWRSGREYGLDGSPLAVMGDSAGGNLPAAVNAREG